ncbi:hypothetical protein KBZ18_11900 [Synechococcus sp. Cruz-9H2]|uniref:hypothetical protein n=1 Tax=unclassified Synechococcus TaxID=2626047 RepID=UPI0020CC74BB|nr:MULTISPECIES: hypothetical protein [unclassified Synechococcus]MCP9820187.1 hypothetical protein [Synechococcus sp. Cruz-9H2]MCP9844573.1 hypothetical protein [Synechococcus sp. Edmonson 11F2]MCP9856617.1 hypothetical protein [Synechococcus sp. Cruz-9C9]MCP9863902.1 hypothetical protein [Synechococcus sp. Cruz-7E5]MCP9871176.1 hypothetical protein [Synechococcus sp. Cruz-7B9]
MLLFSFGVVLLLALPLWSVGQRGLVQERSLPVNPQQELVATNGLGVTVGAYIENLHSLSLRQRIFSAEGYYWLDWPGPVQNLIDSKKIKPSEMVELVNVVNSSAAAIETDTHEPVALPNGHFYQLFRFSANFYIPTVDLRRSPFEQLVLPVVLEVKPDALSRQRSNLILLPDPNQKNSRLGSYASINGYDISGVRFISFNHSYGTDWGLGQENLSFSRLAIAVTMKSDLFSSFVIWILPIMIVMLIVLLAPSLDGELGEIRLAIPSTALLTLIFLQQAYKAEIPSLSYLTFLDSIYACSYVTSLLLFILFVWGSNVYSQAAEDSKAAAVVKIDRMDLIFQRVALIGFIITAIVAWYG